MTGHEPKVLARPSVRDPDQLRFQVARLIDDRAVGGNRKRRVIPLRRQAARVLQHAYGSAGNPAARRIEGYGVEPTGVKEYKVTRFNVER
jgi:hypothetical protein